METIDMLINEIESEVLKAKKLLSATPTLSSTKRFC